MSYQRFNFSNLPPERQKELLEKQLNQRKQREMLLEQIGEKRKTDNNFNENGNSIENRKENYEQRNMMQEDYKYNRSYEVRSCVPNGFDFPITIQYQHQPLLSEKTFKNSQNANNKPLSQLPEQIRNTFAQLRRKIEQI